MSDFNAYQAASVGYLFPDATDRQPDKEAAFQWLRDHGYIEAYLEYSGGNDEGGAREAVLTRANGGKDIIHWRDEGFKILDAPVAYKYGSWAGEFRAWGTLRYDVRAGTCVMEDTLEECSGNTTTYEL